MTSAERKPERAGPEPTRVPALVVAAVLVLLEALGWLGVGVSVVVGSDSGRMLLGVSATVFFLAVGTGLLLCARGLLRVRRWARAPVVLAQLIQILVGWNFLSGATKLVALLLAGVAVVVLVAVLSPAATRALVRDEG